MRAQWCAHYGYDRAERRPTCAAGVDNVGEGKAAPCMPLQDFADFKVGGPDVVPPKCPKRREVSQAEIGLRAIQRKARAERVIAMLEAVRRQLPFGGGNGTLECPCCRGGKIAWRKLDEQGDGFAHILGACSTAECGSFET